MNQPTRQRHGGPLYLKAAGIVLLCPLWVVFWAPLSALGFCWREFVRGLASNDPTEALSPLACFFGLLALYFGQVVFLLWYVTGASPFGLP